MAALLKITKKENTVYESESYPVIAPVWIRRAPFGARREIITRLEQEAGGMEECRSDFPRPM